MDQATETHERRFAWWHTILVVIFGLIVGSIVAGAIIGVTYGFREDNTFDPAANFWIVIPTVVIMQGLALWWVSNRYGTGSMADDYGFEIEPRHAKWLLAGPISLWTLGALAAGYNALLGIDESNPQSLIDAVADLRGTNTVVAIVIGSVVLAPVVEELTFRGLLTQTALDKGLGAIPTTVLTAAVFSLAHAGDPELWSKAGTSTFLVLFLFGVVLAQIRLRTGSIAASIFAHSGFNLTTIVALLFFSDLVTT